MSEKNVNTDETQPHWDSNCTLEMAKITREGEILLMHMRLGCT